MSPSCSSSWKYGSSGSAHFHQLLLFNNMLKIDRKGRVTTLSKALLAASLLSIVGYTNSANAALVTVPFDFFIPGENELFELLITYDDTTLQTSSFPAYANPGITTPTPPLPLLGGPPFSTSTPLLTSPAYDFTGYLITSITGTMTRGAVDPPVTGISLTAGVSGVFNYPETAGNPPIDLIAHSLPDNLFNPNGGFAPGVLPPGSASGKVSYGGFALDVLDTVIEPYQIFTAPIAANADNGLVTAGQYAGCPGSCRGAIEKTRVPGPLPILGFGTAFALSRNLRKRIKGSKSLEAMSALG